MLCTKRSPTTQWCGCHLLASLPQLQQQKEDTSFPIATGQDVHDGNLVRNYLTIFRAKSFVDGVVK